MNSIKTISVLDRFYARYIPGNADFREMSPALDISLGVFANCDASRMELQKLGPHLECLIQGYSVPTNVDALRAMLSGLGIQSENVVAIDKIDVLEVFKRLGAPAPNVEFILADACDMGDCLAGRDFDLIVQDFIINFMPPGKIASLLAGVKRHLKPRGICLISFSSDAFPPSGSILKAGNAGAAKVWDWVSAKTGMVDLDQFMAQNQGKWAADLIGATIQDEGTGQMIHISDPSGQIEHFHPTATIIEAVENAGFSYAIQDATNIVDYNGITCTRYRMMISHSAAADLA